MNVLDLFSGIGGFSLGLERAGMQTVGFCEIEDYPRKVLAKHWPGVTIHRDITELDGRQYRGTVDLVCGGFPCQPFSVAGKQRGDRDDRHLWPEMLRVIREVQPAWVIGENVIGLEGLELDQCVSDLESNGFAVQVFDIPACGVGAIHKRHRLWIIANALCSEVRKPTGGRGWSGRKNTIQHRFIGKARLAKHTNGNGCEQKRGNQPKKKRDEIVGTVGWPSESPVCRADDGIPKRVDRLRALGNAVVPQVVEQIGRAILEVECATPRR